MAWTEQTTNAAASNVVTLAVTAGDLIFVGLGWGSGTLADLTSISDDASNTYTLLTGAADSGNSQSSRGGWAVAGTTATITITGNGIGGFSFLNALAVSYREAGTLSFVDQSTGFAVFGTGTDAVTTGNVTPAVDDLIVCFTQNTGFGALTINPGTGYTLSVANAANPSRMCLIEYKIATSASAQAATATHSNSSEEALFVAVFHGTGAGAPTATIVTGSATATVGVAETYTFKLDASPGAGTVNVTPVSPVAGSWSSSPLALTSANWNTGLTSNITASAGGSGNVTSTNDGGLTNGTKAVTFYTVSRPSAVTPGTWTDEAGGALVVADINDASDATGAMDAAGPDYTALPFTLATPMAAGSQTVYYRGKEILAGKQVRIELFANDGTTLVWSGAWQTMTGTITTYSEAATLSATAYKGEIQKQADPPPVNGIIMPNKTETPHDVMLLWVTTAMVPRSSHTIIWKTKVSSAQTGFHAVWWHLPNAASSWPANTYCFGTHPYPALAGTVDGNGQNTSGSSSTGTVHWYEIAGLGAGDYLATAGSSTVYPVTKDTWVTQARTCEVVGSDLRHRYWPDISNPSDYIEQLITTASLVTPTSERVVFGNSPWDTTECGAGTFRSIKMFDVALSISDIGTESGSGIDNAVTSAGIASIWYSNENPTPTDVSDKQTQRTTHSPSWANASRPTLYTE